MGERQGEAIESLHMVKIGRESGSVKWAALAFGAKEGGGVKGETVVGRKPREYLFYEDQAGQREREKTCIYMCRRGRREMRARATQTL